MGTRQEIQPSEGPGLLRLRATHPAIQHPEITCARLIFGGYEIKTKNFRDTKWKISREIAVTDKWIGTLEVCYLEEKPELEEGPFLKEAKNLINAVAKKKMFLFCA